MFVVRFFPLAGFQEVSEWGVVHAHLLFERERERERDDSTVSKREAKRIIIRAREYRLSDDDRVFPIYPQDTKTKSTLLLLTSDFNSGSGFSVVAADDDTDTDADADDDASGAALFVVVVFSAVSASAATLTALMLLDFCLNDVDVLFVPPLLFDDDAVA